MSINFETEKQNLPPGWRSLVDEMKANLDTMVPDWTLVKMTEAHGGNLRVYIGMLKGWHHGKWYDAWKIVEDFEKAASKICRECGSSDGVSIWARTGLDMKTLCKKHREEANHAHRGA